MTHLFYDNVRETSVGTGTGSFALNGPTAAVPTAAIGRAFSSVFNTGETFDYVIQHRTTNEWEVGVGTWQGSNTFSRDRVSASSNANALVNFSDGTKVVWTGPTAAIREHLANLINIQSKGAVEGQDNTTAITAARTEAGVNRPVLAPSAVYTAPWGVKNISSLDFAFDQYGEGSAYSLSQGTAASPSTSASPVIYVEKTTAGHPTNVNDHGGIDVRVKRVGGSNGSNTYGIFSAIESAGGGGIVTPYFCIAKASDPTAEYVTGSRIYVNKTVALTAGFLTGMDITMYDTSGQDAGWMDTNAAGSTTGISVINEPGRGTFGMRVSTGAAGNGFYTGFLIDQDSVMPTSFFGNAEAIRVKGGSSGAKKYGGVWLQSGNFTYGVNLVGPTYDNGSALVIKKDDRITFGDNENSSTFASWTSSDFFNINQGKYAINATQVVGPRITGWTTPTGTASRAGFATASATAEDCAKTLMALIQDLKQHGLLGS